MLTKLSILAEALLIWFNVKVVLDTLDVLGDPLAKVLLGVLELVLVLLIFIVVLVCIVWFPVVVVADTVFRHNGSAKLKLKIINIVYNSLLLILPPPCPINSNIEFNKTT